MWLRLLSELAKHVSSEKLEAIKLEDGLEQMEPDVTVSANKKQAGDEVAKPNGRAGSMPQKQIEFKNDGFSLVRSLLKAQHSFVISDPLLADNPIIYASNGFYDMTGYSADEIARFSTTAKAFLRVGLMIDAGLITTLA